MTCGLDVAYQAGVLLMKLTANYAILPRPRGDRLTGRCRVGLSAMTVSLAVRWKCVKDSRHDQPTASVFSGPRCTLSPRTGLGEKTSFGTGVPRLAPRAIGCRRVCGWESGGGGRPRWRFGLTMGSASLALRVNIGAWMVPGKGAEARGWREKEDVGACWGLAWGGGESVQYATTARIDSGRTASPGCNSMAVPVPRALLDSAGWSAVRRLRVSERCPVAACSLREPQ